MFKWLQKGDRNAAYFHAVCNERKRRNFIGRLKKGDGGREDKEEGKREIIANYCSNIFRSNGPMNFQALLSRVPPAVTSEMNQQLLGDFSSEEVKGALESIGDLKAPGPDGNGIPSVFYKNCWKQKWLLKL
jgi:hypothetical protein